MAIPILRARRLRALCDIENDAEKLQLALAMIDIYRQIGKQAECCESIEDVQRFALLLRHANEEAFLIHWGVKTYGYFEHFGVDFTPEQ